MLLFFIYNPLGNSPEIILNATDGADGSTGNGIETVCCSLIVPKLWPDGFVQMFNAMLG
jgi:hypothetical protein